MPLTVILTSGPRMGGKTTLIDLIAREVLDHVPHHVRLVPAGMARRYVQPSGSPVSPSHVATSVRVTISPESAMDRLTEALRAIRRQERYATVFVEGDDLPGLRHVFPFDRQIFVMPCPSKFHAVFRRPGEAAAALRKVMQDTEGFASEMFGLLVEETGSSSPEAYCPDDRRRHSSRALESYDISRFLRTPIGAEIASRIQLQPGYQGMVESDVVIVNTALGTFSDDCDACIHGIDRLLSRIRPNGSYQGCLFSCDFHDPADPMRTRLLRRLANVCDDPL